MTMRRLLVCMLLLTFVAGLSTLLVATAAAAQQETSRLSLVNAQLIRCGPQSELPAFRFDLSVIDNSGQGVPAFRTIDKQNVRVIQTNPTLEYQPFFVSGDAKTAQTVSGERYVLIFFDVSGSMNDPVAAAGRRKFEIAQDAVSTVLEQFHNPTDHVAIAAFESHNVIPNILKTRFVSNADAAIQQLRNLPQPSPK